MNKIKLVYIVNQLGLGGLEKNLLDICMYSDLSKFDITILSFSNDNLMLERYILSPQIKIYYFDYNFSDDYSILGYFKLAFNSKLIETNKTIKKLLDIEPDIINFHTTPRELILGHSFLKLSKNKKTVLIYTDQLVRFQKNEICFFKQQLLAVSFRKLYSKFHHIYVSNSVANFAKRYSLLEKGYKSRIIENTVDVNYFKKSLNTSTLDFFKIIYPARLSDVKGHKFLIQAFKLFLLKMESVNKNIKYKLLLLGDGELKNELMEFTNSIGIHNNVDFLGYKKDVKQILNECVVGVFPSQKEGLPLALLEMMSMSLPTLASDIPEIVDLIEDGYNGVIFHLNDLNDFVYKLENLVKDENLRISLAVNSRLSVEKRFGRSSNATMYEEFYFDLLN
jgi:glycosyltransferase involved in cell wall biosynthesis